MHQRQSIGTNARLARAHVLAHSTFAHPGGSGNPASTATPQQAGIPLAPHAAASENRASTALKPADRAADAVALLVIVPCMRYAPHTSPVPAQTWGWGEPSPGADVGMG